MSKFKNSRTIFLTTVLTIGISVITSHNSFAATAETYTVKSGDCLSVIAKTHGESLNNLMKANSDCNGPIFPGQILKIPNTTSSTKALTKPLASKSSAIKYTSSDFSLLARLITAEARGESYKAQLAVGSVVVNRVKSGHFPNSLSAVINQKTNGFYQFTPIQSGSINTSANATAVKAAKTALSGTDPTNKALFFYSGKAPKALTVKQPGTIKIDNLTFVSMVKN